MKLVRDKVPSLIKAEGREPSVIWVSGDTAAISMNLLRDKLVEEATEVYQATTTEELVSEVADVLEVCYTMLEHFGKTPQDAEQARQEKLAHSGGFKQLVLLL